MSEKKFSKSKISVNLNNDLKTIAWFDLSRLTINNACYKKKDMLAWCSRSLTISSHTIYHANVRPTSRLFRRQILSNRRAEEDYGMLKNILATIRAYDT